VSSQDLEPGDVLDDFEISSVLARSGMGSIFRAKQRSTGRAVVLKVPHLHFESDVAFYSRFLREERIGLRLDHHAIVKVIPNAKRSRQYLVMEYVEGPSLWRMMKAQGRIPVDLALDIGRQICEALAYMHRAGVVHRDLKPENIVIDSSDRAHIIDFGIALDFSDRRITWGRLSSRLGTPEYMAPEQIRGKRGDGRVDVYALGIILYEMLSGRSAYVAESPALLIKAKSKRDARPLSDVAPNVDPRIAAVISRAIARDPKDRYANADAMLDALRDPSRAQEEQTARTPAEGPRGFWPRLVASLIRD
jgi:eukaryotic-like serine/threonine-protein kinase